MSKGFKCDLCSVVLTSKFNLDRHRGSKRCVSKAKACGLDREMGGTLPEVTIVHDDLSPDKTVDTSGSHVLACVKAGGSPTLSSFRRLFSSTHTPYRLRMFHQRIDTNGPLKIRFTRADADLILNLRVKVQKVQYGILGINLALRLGDCTLLDGLSMAHQSMLADADGSINLSGILFGDKVQTLNNFNVLNHPLELEFFNHGRMGLSDVDIDVWADLVTLSDDERRRFDGIKCEVFINQFETCTKSSIDTVVPVSAIYRSIPGQVRFQDIDLGLVPTRHTINGRPDYYYSVTPSSEPATSLTPATLTNALPPGNYEFCYPEKMDRPLQLVAPNIVQYITVLTYDLSGICCYKGLTLETQSPKEVLYQRCCQLYQDGDITSLNVALGDNRELAAAPVYHCLVVPPQVWNEPNWYGGYGTSNIHSDLSLPAIMDLECWSSESKLKLEETFKRLYQKSKVVPMLHSLDSVYVYGRRMIDEINMEEAKSRCPAAINAYYQFEAIVPYKPAGVNCPVENRTTVVTFPGWLWIACFEMGAYPSDLFMYLSTFVRDMSPV